jgi:TM2 domain-containing membrane protein YozV
MTQSQHPDQPAAEGAAPEAGQPIPADQFAPPAAPSDAPGPDGLPHSADPPVQQQPATPPQQFQGAQHPPQYQDPQQHQGYKAVPPQYQAPQQFQPQPPAAAQQYHYPPAPPQQYQAQPPQMSYQPPMPNPAYGYPQPKSRIVAGLLGIFLGGLGIHRFYLGYTAIGIIQIALTVFLGILTFGLIGLWGLVEGIMIFAGASYFNQDAKGIPLRD